MDSDLAIDTSKLQAGLGAIFDANEPIPKMLDLLLADAARSDAQRIRISVTPVNGVRIEYLVGGQWGRARCDPPIHILEALLGHLFILHAYSDGTIPVKSKRRKAAIELSLSCVDLQLSIPPR